MVRSGLSVLQVTASVRKKASFSEIAEKCMNVLEDFLPKNYCELDHNQYDSIRAEFKSIGKISRRCLTSG